MARRFLDRSPLQFAKHDGDPILVRQMAQLRIQEDLHLLPHLFGGLRPGYMSCLLLFPTTLASQGSCLQGRMVSDPVEPVAELRPAPDGACLAKEHEEGGLESILGVAFVPQDTTADAEHHGAVSPQKAFARCLLPSQDILAKQLTVCQSGAFLGERRLTQTHHHSVQAVCRHTGLPEGRSMLITSWR